MARVRRIASRSVDGRENGARVLSTKDIGTLDIGRRADFVLYRGNVEEGAFDLTRVIAVGKSGVVYVADGK